MSGEVNYSFGYPSPEIGTTVWMRCPYDADLCGTDAEMLVTCTTEEYVEGLVTCVNGHRWKIAKLQGALDTESEEE